MARRLSGPNIEALLHRCIQVPPLFRKRRYYSVVFVFPQANRSGQSEEFLRYEVEFESKGDKDSDTTVASRQWAKSSSPSGDGEAIVDVNILDLEHT